MLRIGVVQAGRVAEERIIKQRTHVTVGASEKNMFVVSTQNLPPTVDASATQGPCFAPVSLSAFAVDPEGQPLTFSWQQTGGPAVQLQSTTSSSTSFAPPSVSAETTLTFTVTVSDGEHQASDTVSITIQPNRPPTVNAGDQSVLEDLSRQILGLSGGGSDPDQCPLTFSWVQVGGPEAALWIFAVFYLVCAATTWWYYARRNAEIHC